MTRAQLDDAYRAALVRLLLAVARAVGLAAYVVISFPLMALAAFVGSLDASLYVIELQQRADRIIADGDRVAADIKRYLAR